MKCPAIPKSFLKFWRSKSNLDKPVFLPSRCGNSTQFVTLDIGVERSRYQTPILGQEFLLEAPMEEAFNFEAIRTELGDYVGALRALVHQREMEDDEGEDVENALDLSDEKVMTLLEDRSQFAALRPNIAI